MKRPAVAYAILFSLIGVTAPAQAATSTDSSHHTLADSFKSQGRSVSLHRSGGRIQQHDVRLYSPTGVSASQLALPASAYSPAVVNSQFTGTETAAIADTNFFAGFHTPSPNGTYEQLQFQNGYYTRADWSVSNDTIYFRYQGSIYPSTAAASNAWTDGITYTQQSHGISQTDCSNDVGMPCGLMAYADGQGATVYYAAFQYNQCLGEISASGTAATVSSQSTQIATTLANMLLTGAGILKTTCSPGGGPTPTSPPLTKTPIPTLPPPTVTPTPTSPPPTRVSFTVISLRVEKYGAAADWKQVRTPLIKVKVKQKVQFSIYFNVTSAPAGETFTIHLTITRGGKTVVTQDFTNKISATSPLDTYRDRIYYTVKSKGTYRVSETLTMGGHPERVNASFQGLAKVITPKPVSFSFDKLEIVNGSGKTQGKIPFRAGQQVGLSYTYTVHNVKGTTSLAVIRAYRHFTKSVGWVPIGHAVPEYGDTSQGTHTIRVFSVPNPTYPTQQVIVGITVGGSYREKTAYFTIQ